MGTLWDSANSRKLVMGGFANIQVRLLSQLDRRWEKADGCVIGKEGTHGEIQEQFRYGPS